MRMKCSCYGASTGLKCSGQRGSYDASRFKKGETAGNRLRCISVTALGVTHQRSETTMAATKVDTVAPPLRSSRRVNSTVPNGCRGNVDDIVADEDGEMTVVLFRYSQNTRAAAESPSSARLFRRIWSVEENAVSEAAAMEMPPEWISAAKSVILPSIHKKGNHTNSSVFIKEQTPQSASLAASSPKREPAAHDAIWPSSSRIQKNVPPSLLFRDECHINAICNHTILRWQASYCCKKSVQKYVKSLSQVKAPFCSLPSGC